MRKETGLLAGLAAFILSTTLLPARGEQVAESPPPQKGSGVLREYLGRQKQKDAVVAEVKRQSGKSFSGFTQEDYARFMGKLDLALDDDLWKWSHVTGIHIAAFNKRSYFFHFNAHLLEDVEAAEEMSWKELAKIKTMYDRKSRTLILQGPDGERLPIRKLPDGIIQHTRQTGGPDRVRYYTRDRLVLEALGPYLVPFKGLARIIHHD